ATLATHVEVYDARTREAAGSEVKLWEATTGKERVTLPEWGGWGQSASFSPDGKTLAFPRYDKSAKKWNLRLRDTDRGELRVTLEGKGPVAFSPDGRTLAFRGDGTIKLRDMVTGQERTLFQLDT